MKIKVLVGKPGVEAGGVYEARQVKRQGMENLLVDLAPDYQIVEGEAIGERIPFGDAVVWDKEPTYTKAQYNEVLQQRDKAIDDLAKYAQELAELKSDRQMMLETIKKAAGEQRLVELPREVAEAVENLRNCDFSDYGIIIESHVISSITKWPPGIAKSLETIRKFTYQNAGEDAVGDSGADLLLKALVNGYTVEQTPKERLQAKVEELIYSWLDSPVDEAGVEEIHRLAGQIVEHAKQLT